MRNPYKRKLAAQSIPPMNVTEEALRAYITTFHETLNATAHQFLPEEDRPSLLHTSLLPARIIGYVSTQFGAGVEYIPATSTTIETVRGFARVEDLFVRAPAAARATGPCIKFEEGSGEYMNSGGIFRLTLQGAFPFRLAGPRSAARFGEVAFAIGHWHRKVEYAEIFGSRALDFWTNEQAVARAKDEVLAALAQTKRAEALQLSLPEYITKFKERTVLLLGDYDEPGLGRLSGIATALSEKGYDPNPD